MSIRESDLGGKGGLAGAAGADREEEGARAAGEEDDRGGEVGAVEEVEGAKARDPPCARACTPPGLR
eukprot:2025585-Rhodomonas_salina.1